MFKNLLVPTTGGPTDASVLATARLAAQAFAAHLEFLHVRVDTTEVLMSMTAGGVGGGDAVQSVIDRMEAEAEANAAAARQAVADGLAAAGIPLRDAPDGAGPSAQISQETGSQSAWVAQYGRFADLIVMGRGGPDDGAAETLEAALMDTGKPLLIAPSAPPASLGRRIVIAWKDTPEAARAVSCALPFIGQAEQVTIVTVLDDADAKDESGGRLLRALRWHNRAVQVRALPRGRASAVEVLHREAEALGADLLVMGGYSHSRLREVVFGGFTRSTLGNASIPVLMAH
jgi:nucleotide-binding universal stress UspA family protein